MGKRCDRYALSPSVSRPARVSLAERGGLSSSLRDALAYALDLRFSGVASMDGNDKDDREVLLALRA